LDRQLASANAVSRVALDDEDVGAALIALRRVLESGDRLDAPLAPPREPFRRRRWATLGAITAVIGVALLVGVELVPGGAGSAGFPLAVPPAAAAELDRVAHAAALQAVPGPGQWEYLETEYVATSTFSHKKWTVADTDTQTTQTWFQHVIGDGPSRLRTTNNSFSFLTGQDRATYLAHKAGFDSGGLNGFMTGAPVEDQMSSGDGTRLPVWATSPTSNPRRLASEIGSTNLWSALTELLSQSTSSKLRSTAYAALAYVKGAKVLGGRKDHLGRSGIEITYRPPGDDFLLTLIVSPSTGDPLESDMTLESRGGALPSTYSLLPIGTVVERDIFLKRAIVATDTALPDGGNQPFRATPSAPGS
jgi:hypothetical protein